MNNFIISTINKFYNKKKANELFTGSYLLQYLEKKTKPVDRSSKSRGSLLSLDIKMAFSKF